MTNHSHHPDSTAAVSSSKRSQSENFESIHNHFAYAQTERDKELPG
jgi:GTP cyclohydrolase FolE2